MSWENVARDCGSLKVQYEHRRDATVDVTFGREREAAAREVA